MAVAAGGKIVHTNCFSRCSVPIAHAGRVAGYDFAGPRILEAPDAAVACPAVIAAEDDACQAVGGTSIAAADCKVLCSKPITK